MKKTNKDFLKLEETYLNFIKKQETPGQHFYDKTRQLKKIYIPISEIIYKKFLYRSPSLSKSGLYLIIIPLFK